MWVTKTIGFSISFKQCLFINLPQVFNPKIRCNLLTQAVIPKPTVSKTSSLSALTCSLISSWA